MRGLLWKIFFEVRWQLLIFSVGLAIIMGLLTALLPKVLGDIHHLFDRLPLIRPLLTALLGVDPGKNLTGTMTQAFLWVHPTLLTAIWAHEVIYCTRTPAGEVDRGTIDFLLGLPVSRGLLFISEIIGWLATGVVILASGYIGHLIASIYLAPDMRPPLNISGYVMLNLLTLYLAVGGFSFMVAAVSDRRGRAMGVIFAVLLVSFLINFVAQFWDPFQPEQAQSVAPFGPLSIAPNSPLPGPTLAMFSVLHYYRPALIIQQAAFPWSDIGLLLAVATICLTIAAVCLHRRSICTV
ncbi:MAG: ABC transporter permease subunit [Pirellulaceae bacterium]|nr:ABC transporter permease subunit [Pirellulaceae bacterium]